MKKPSEIDLGFKVDFQKLWSLDLPTEEVRVNDLSSNFDIPYLESEGTDDWNLSINQLIKNFDYEKTHSEKVKRADLSYPIDLTYFKGQWIILDGVHRLTKAITNGDKAITLRRIPLDQVPQKS